MKYDPWYITHALFWIDIIWRILLCIYDFHESFHIRILHPIQRLDWVTFPLCTLVSKAISWGETTVISMAITFSSNSSGFAEKATLHRQPLIPPTMNSSTHLLFINVAGKPVLPFYTYTSTNESLHTCYARKYVHVYVWPRGGRPEG